MVDESDHVAGLAVQGPTSWSVLDDAGFSVAKLKPLDWREAEPDLWISRTGFTGDLGFELWMPRAAALAVWDRLWAAGQHWGLRAIGSEALDLARIEAGFIAAGVDFQPVHGALRLHRGRTPIELGFENLVDWDKGHFNGRRALLKQRDIGPRTRLIRLDVGGFKPAHGALVYHGKRREVGHVTSGAWSPTTKRNIAFAEVKAPYADRDLWVEIYVNEEGRWDRRMLPAKVHDGAFFRNPRARQTPPAPF
jgi:aminomethyltransferase